MTEGRRPSPSLVLLMLCAFYAQSAGGAILLGAPAAVQAPATPSAGPFPQDALPANRSGRLTDEQLRRWQEIARERHNSGRGGAYLAGAIGTILLVGGGTPSKAVARRIIGAASIALVPVILMVANHDALLADLREGRVESTEGAIAKRIVRGRSLRTFYFDIARHRLTVSRSGYDAAPDAGIVRVYFLPRSRRVVNLERVSAPSLPSETDVAQIVASLIGAVRSRDPVALAEARARAAALADVIRGPAVGSGATTRFHDDELYGSWTNVLMTLTFTRGGVATLATSAGPVRSGHWAIDANGRLLTDATGTMEPADAWLEGNRLWISISGKTVMFTRGPGVQ